MLKRASVVCAIALVLAFIGACKGKSPTGASGANYAGTWNGTYHIDTCTATFLIDSWCPSALGSTAPLQLSLTQSGSSVTGTIAFQNVTGSVSGTVGANGVLSLSGTASTADGHFTLTAWSTTVSGTSMSGTFTFQTFLNDRTGQATNGCRIVTMTRS